MDSIEKRKTEAIDRLRALGGIRAEMMKPKQPTMAELEEAGAFLALSNSRAELAVSNGQLIAGTPPALMG